MKKEQGSLNYVNMEEEVLKFWQENDTFSKLKTKNKSTGKYFATLDGPITANSNMGLHHAYNRTFKDAMIKFAAINGCDEHFQNGFDAHGLPVELRVEGELGLNSKKEIEAYGIDKFVEKCLQTVDKYSASQTKSSIRLGQWMNWNDSYYTNSDNNITTIWHFLKKCQDKGYIANSHRIMRWCTRCGTSLSDHEMSDQDAYKDVTCLAIFFKCPIKGTNNDMLVWTTTPWTLSANVAVAVNPEFDYNVVKIKSSERNVIVCANVMKVLKDDVVEVVKTVKGSELVGLTYETCFPELSEQQFEHKIVAWDLVDSSEGTGAVHIAPGCGDADFELGKQLGLPKVMPIDEAGIYYDNFGLFAGRNANTDELRDFVFEEMKKREAAEKSAAYAKISEQYGEGVADALRAQYALYDERFYLWLADLYNPGEYDGDGNPLGGGFYYSNSARDTEGYLIDIESTSQALSFLVASGMMRGYENNYMKAIPEKMQREMVAFALSLQSPEDGYFYHPQIGRAHV